MFQYLFESAITLAHMPLNYLLNIVDPPVVVLVYHRVTSLRSEKKLAGLAIFLLKLTYKGDGLNFLKAQHDVEVSW